MDYDRSLMADLTYPFQYEMTGMMIRAPEKYDDHAMLIVTAPFKWEVCTVFLGNLYVKMMTYCHHFC